MNHREILDVMRRAADRLFGGSLRRKTDRLEAEV
jgi:hypothetical protein